MLGITSKQMRKYEDAFSKLGNKKDLLSVDSLGDYIRLTGLSIVPDVLDDLVPEYNIDGYINFPSILDMMARIQAPPEPENERTELINLFKILDEYDTGYIYVDELKQACLLAGSSLREREFDHIMYATGLSGKDRLSFYEYMNVLLKVPRDSY